MAKKPSGKKAPTGLIKLIITGGVANPSPPVGPALGQHGVNIKEFCDAFNTKTEAQRGMPIPVEISVYKDRSFTFITKTPPASYLILTELGLKSGSPTPNTKKIGKLTQTQVEKIAELKWPNLTAADINAAMNTIMGTARSMGIEVEGA